MVYTNRLLTIIYTMIFYQYQLLLYSYILKYDYMSSQFLCYCIFYFMLQNFLLSFRTRVSRLDKTLSFFWCPDQSSTLDSFIDKILTCTKEIWFLLIIQSNWENSRNIGFKKCILYMCVYVYVCLYVYTLCMCVYKYVYVYMCI